MPNTTRWVSVLFPPRMGFTFQPFSRWWNWFSLFYDSPYMHSSSFISMSVSQYDDAVDDLCFCSGAFWGFWMHTLKDVFTSLLFCFLPCSVIWGSRITTFQILDTFSGFPSDFSDCFWRYLSLHAVVLFYFSHVWILWTTLFLFKFNFKHFYGFKNLKL